MTVRIERLNESKLRVTSDDFGIEQELCDHFTFDVPGARFMPRFKAKIWDGKIRCYDIYRKTIASGLLGYVKKFCEDSEYEVVVEERDTDSPTFEEVREFVDSLNIHSDGQKLSVHDYQYDAIYRAIADERKLLLSPTSSGKSLIIYAYIRWHLAKERRIVLMVTRVSLVYQMVSDFKDYASEVDWDPGEFIHTLYSGQEKTFEKPVLVTTWQSILSIVHSKKLDVQEFFKLWDVYIGDEAHEFASNEVQKISDKFVNARYRLGTTGTIKKEKIQKLTLEGSFGPVYQVITTKELMDRGTVANLKIKCFVLNHRPEAKKLFKQECYVTKGKTKKVDYQKELSFVVSLTERTDFVSKLSKATKGNTLVLFEFIEKQGKPLHDRIKELCPDRPVYYIDGSVDPKYREQIRKELGQVDNAIIIASYKTTSTGINIPSIENVIFASPFKSRIKGLQSIGRGIRLKEGKTSCTLFDISDWLSTTTRPNITAKHFKERINTYTEEQFKYTIQTINL